MGRLRSGTHRDIYTKRFYHQHIAKRVVFVNKTTLFMSFFACYVFAGKAQGCERNEDVVTYGDLSESTDNAVFRKLPQSLDEYFNVVEILKDKA